MNDEAVRSIMKTEKRLIELLKEIDPSLDIGRPIRIFFEPAFREKRETLHGEEYFNKLIVVQTTKEAEKC